MKKKNYRILGVGAIIALLASFTVPVAADVSQPLVALGDETISATTDYTITFDVTDEVVPYVLERGSAGGSAEWSATEKRSGTYSIHLSDGGTGYDTNPNYYGRVVIPDVNIALADLLTAGDLSYYFNYFDDPGTGYPDAFPYMILAVDSGGGTTVDGWIVLLSGGESYQPAQNTWVKWDISAWDHWLGAGAVSGVGSDNPLSDFDTAHANADVVDVKVAVGEWHTGTYTPITGYVDDIHIEGTTYDIEPEIVVEFPEDTIVDTTWANADVTVQSTAGFGVKNDATDVGDDVVTLEEDDIYTVAIGAGQLTNDIAEAATVRVKFLGDQITNPDTPGDYTLWVSTSEELTPVESATYAIEIPIIDPLPGIVELYNPANILMALYTGDDAIQSAIDDAGEDWTIKVYTGTYTTNVDVNVDHLTIQSENGPYVTTVVAADSNDHVFEVTASYVAIEGFTAYGGGTVKAGIFLASGADHCTIANNRCGYDTTHKSYYGIWAESSNNTISNNTCSGNDIYGIWLNLAEGNTISGNIIAFNGGDGVFVLEATENAILSNHIFSNSDLGIDLSPDGVTPNDAGDTDTGANNLQNFPVLTSATTGSSTTIEGSLNSTPDMDFRLEFFSNSACDPSSHGEGETFLGSASVTTNGSGNASFSITFPHTVPVGYFITATATDPNNNTSEFSQCMQVTTALVEATVDFDPDTLNLKSRGKVVTAYIELPGGYDVQETDISTVMLNGIVPALAHPTDVADYDSDGVSDLMVKFNRADVQEILEPGDEVEVTVTGELADGTTFVGSDTIRVIEKGKK